MNLLFLITGAYLLGSIPTALWISRWFFGIDIREHGSKNMGASNTFRVLGAGWGILVLIIDICKSFLAVQLVHWLNPHEWLASEPMFWQLILGLISVVGHVFPVFAGFRGGKGVASLLGVVLAIQPWTALIVVCVFGVIVGLTRFVSLGSLAGVLVFALCVFFAVKESDLYYKTFAAAAALFVVIAHIPNMKRLLKGTENRLNFRKRKNPNDD